MMAARRIGRAIGRAIGRTVKRILSGTLFLSLGGLLGALVGLFSFAGALLVPAVAVGALMLAVPYSSLYAIVAVTPVNVEITGSITVTRLVVMGSLGVIAFQAVTRRAPMPTPFLWPEGIAAVAFFAAITISSLAYGTSELGGRLGPFFIYAVIFFVVLNHADDPVRFRRVLWIIVVTAVLQALLVMAEALYGFSPFGGWHQELAEDRGDEEVRVVGTHAHPITLAGFFQVAIPAAIGLALTNRIPLLTLPLLGASALFVIGWWYTFARSSWIGMVMLLMAAMLTASRGTRTLGLIGGFFAFTLLAIYDFSTSAIIQDIESLAVLRSASQRAGVAAGSESLTWRLENWSAAVSMFLDNPLFGVGIDQSPRFMLEHLPLGSVAHTYITTAQPHNIFLQIAAENGILAIVTFLVLWILAFRALLSARHNDALRPYAITVFAMLAAQLGTFFFNPMPREIWLTLALAMALGRIHARSLSRPPEPASPPFAAGLARPIAAPFS